jgi:toxin ParE1/3/4
LKRIATRQRATQDIENAVDYYLVEASPSVATQWLESYSAALDHISEFPRTGSPKYAKLSKFKSLRFWLLNRFPYMVLYQELPQHIEIIRVLHQASDIPKHLQNNEP